MSSRFLRSMFAAAAALALTGCGAGNSGYGTLALELVDAPSPEVKGIVVTVDKVTVHSDQAGWVTVRDDEITVDLLALQNFPMQLGEVSLPAGTVSEIRLQLKPDGTQYVELADGTHAPLKTPSGSTSGEKLKGPFTVSACTKHTLTIDFDGKNSIAYHETGGPIPEWILRPVIRVKTEAVEPTSCAPAPLPAPGTPSDAGSDAGQGGDPDAGTPDGGYFCDPSNPSCPT